MLFYLNRFQTLKLSIILSYIKNGQSVNAIRLIILNFDQSLCLGPCKIIICNISILINPDPRFRWCLRDIRISSTIVKLKYLFLTCLCHHSSFFCYDMRKKRHALFSWPKIFKKGKWGQSIGVLFLLFPNKCSTWKKGKIDRPLWCDQWDGGGGERAHCFLRA